MYLFVGAVEEELAPLKIALSDRNDCQYFCCGVGSIVAAAKLSQKLSSIKEDVSVVFIGSCGLLDENVELLSLLISSDVSLAEQSLLNDTSYLPEIMPTCFKANSALIESFSGAKQASFYSCTGITSDSLFRDKLAARFGKACENLELFGIAVACAEHDVSWVALSCATNYVGPNAHSEWKKNFQIAAKHIAKYLAENLTRTN